MIHYSVFCVIEIFSNLSVIVAYKVCTGLFTKAKVNLIISKQSVFKENVFLFRILPLILFNFNLKRFRIYVEIVV